LVVARTASAVLTQLAKRSLREVFVLEALIVILLLLWLFGYFGRGRWYGGRGPVVAAPRGLASGNLVHILLVIVVILVILRLLGVD